MNQSVQWSLLAGATLALLLMAPVSTRRDGKPTVTVATAAAKSVQQSLSALNESRSDRDEQSEAGAFSLLLAGGAGAWLVRRRNSASSQ